MKTTDLLLLGLLGVGGYLLLRPREAPAQSTAPGGTTVVPVPVPVPTTPSPTPSPSPSPTTTTPAQGFDLSHFLSQITQIALDLFPQGSPPITIGPTPPATTTPGTLPPTNPWFDPSKYNFGPGWDIFGPGEVTIGGVR